MKIAMAQMLVTDQIEDNLRRAEGMIARAASQGCSVVVLPECCDFGWMNPAARGAAGAVPGPVSRRLSAAATKHRVYVAAGLAEKSGERLYNAAVLIGPDGSVLTTHRKINELAIAHDLYGLGQSINVVDTPIGRIGLAICADLLPNANAIGHALGLMRCQVILSPAAWAVQPDHDNAKNPYGKEWRQSYREIAARFGLSIVGVSNVGRVGAGPWRGYLCIGCSLAIGPGGEILAQGPYGENAEALIEIEVAPGQTEKCDEIARASGAIRPG